MLLRLPDVRGEGPFGGEDGRLTDREEPEEERLPEDDREDED